ncbi:twin-arginine translocase TatA/TatE family subunit [Kamptonema cortianum]|jgi:sec-independent protein translocase protein TatA|nr:twin-arginine translocase TatA/TatE family subunit [Alphaproteobacteria bacterium]MBX9621881.1 twin-arginine translocase TatA/TatE family subunit [Alphaproteobacteria bacterium]MBX9787221.1 twin-arginine translocase TatA/TatE family subunit [Alphaproteobacteria bacterium]MDI9637508.1 twin-arginine translocase TatA/TatE family subunit [Geitlerinema splendidum]MDK3157764.1 twin-arginine translocase TatA/TatE family subunit [Kamptonema cortianum]
MGLSLSHILLVLVAVVLVFGAKRLPSIMQDLAKGLRAFKDGLKDGEEK